MYLKSLHHYNFRHGKENPRVLEQVMSKPEKYEARMCYKVLYESDGLIDYVPVIAVEDGEWELIK